MSVKARFNVNSITHTKHGNGWANPAPVGSVKLGAVGGKENEDWASATPAGAIEMTIGNPKALEWFYEHLGSSVEITFDDVPSVR